MQELIDSIKSKKPENHGYWRRIDASWKDTYHIQ
jgi:hypothetical protein